MTRFLECASCAAKPGSPSLCERCLWNRNTISNLTARAEKAEAEARAMVAALADRIAQDGDTMRVAVNAMTPILRADMDASAWPTVNEMRNALVAALRAIEAEDA